MPETLIDFIRHGEPVGGRRYRGDSVDDPLSENGWRQMWATVGERPPWGRVISSPLQRCSAFAEALAEKHALPVASEARFREVGLGSWEGLSPDEIIARDAAGFDAFYQDPCRNRPPGAEPLELFGQRVAEAFEAVLEAHPGEHILIVAHAGVIRAALGYVLQAAPEYWYRTRIDNAALTGFRRGRFGTLLEFHNRSSLD
ncbi:MAG: alpha-ribazole phosphatase family protein [Thiogranum sp.]|nr:alpha-ribazole phosphatase family protein [Thiogranum sp.]